MKLCFAAMLLMCGAPSVDSQTGGSVEAPCWPNLATTCILSGDANVMFEDEDVYAFSCGAGDERFVFMINLGDEKRIVERTGEVEPLVPIFSSGVDLDAVPSIVITLPEDGTAMYSNPIPPGAFVVFRPIRQDDIRPHGLDE